MVIDFAATPTSPAHRVSAHMVCDRIRFSLGTADKATVAVRHGLALAHVESIWQRLRVGSISLAHMQTVALAGEAYHLIVAEHQREPGTKEEWAARKALDRAVQERRAVPLDALPPFHATAAVHVQAAKAMLSYSGVGTSHAVDALPVVSDDAEYAATLERRYGHVVDRVLGVHGLVIDEASRSHLLSQVATAAADAAQRLKRNAAGDYSPDPKEQRFPPLSLATVSEPRKMRPSPSRGPSWDDVLACWSARSIAANKAAKTRSEWAAFVPRFAKFAGKPPVEISRRDVRAWVSKRLADGINPNTIASRDVAAIRTIFKSAIEDELFSDSFINPATNVPVPTPTGAARGERVIEARGYTDEEAAYVVKAATEQANSLGAHRDARQRRRWQLLLMLVTGARANEIGKLRKMDIRQLDGHWCISINTEAGRVKARSSIRDVPLHPRLLEHGFLDWVEGHGTPETWLFLSRRRDPNAERPGTTAGNKLADWLRKLPGLAVGREVHGLDPNHGFRHAFRTRGRAVGISKDVLDALHGHAPGSVGDDYGAVPISVKVDAVAKMAVPGL